MTRQEAIAAGLTTYLGKVCVKHVVANGARYTASKRCVECNRERWRAYKQSERGRAYSRERFRTSQVRKANMLAGRHRRRARKLGAIPQGADVRAINRVFRALVNEARKVGMTIDHIVPLAGCRVCGERGMHVQSNWALLSFSDNCSKKDRCMSCWRKA